MTSVKPEDSIENVSIMGSGPAGYTAALYAARANLEPLLFTGLQPGGQLMLTTEVENYPGYPEGTLGPKMMEDFRKQAERFGTRIVEAAITHVDLNRRPFKLSTGDKEYFSRTLIIATGAEAKWLGVPGEKEYAGYGVSACATCDGYFFRDKHVIVVGGGDTAMEDALFLTRYCKQVTVIHRRDELRASKIMQQRAFQNEKIDFVWNTVVVEILGEDAPKKHVIAVRLRNTVDGSEKTMPIDGVFVAIGHRPNSELFKGFLEMDELGYIKTQPWRTLTNVPGVFACGDVMDRIYRQAVTAAGTGCMAAIDAERFLEAEEHHK